ncbi:hypothetical protein PR002_g3013 [Phytophthora rubi]|uniref:Uncharacterized protein n=1 Tax=Phytophthora rubi TaxID=129364 RepID=A0A6A3NSA0_9STRA|nr:hypothetical protein PR002_g3013 [Phytophthora rubi]
MGINRVVATGHWPAVEWFLKLYLVASTGGSSPGYLET